MILANGKSHLGLSGFLSVKAFGAFYFSFASSKFYLGLINNSGYGFGPSVPLITMTLINVPRSDLSAL